MMIRTCTQITPRMLHKRDTRCLNCTASKDIQYHIAYDMVSLNGNVRLTSIRSSMRENELRKVSEMLVSVSNGLSEL